MDKIAVLIPCFNEAKTIEKVVKDFKKVLPEAVIYVYDNAIPLWIAKYNYDILFGWNYLLLHIQMQKMM